MFLLVAHFCTKLDLLDYHQLRSYWDNRTREIYGLKPGEGALPRETWQSFIDPDDRELTEKAHAVPLSTATATKVCYRIV
jgi:hypothetical protein